MCGSDENLSPEEKARRKREKEASKNLDSALAGAHDEDQQVSGSVRL